MMKKLAVVFMAAVLLAAAVVSSDAMMKKGRGARDMGKGMHCEQMMAERLSALGLDAKQKEAVKAIHLKMKKESIKKKSEIEIAGIEVRELITKDPVDMAAVEVKVKQLESLRTEMKLMHLKAREEVKATLTPDQRKKFNEMPMMGCADCGMGGGMMDCGKNCDMPGKGPKKPGCDKCRMQGSDDDMPARGPHAGHKH